MEKKESQVMGTLTIFVHICFVSVFFFFFTLPVLMLLHKIWHRYVFIYKFYYFTAISLQKPFCTRYTILSATFGQKCPHWSPL